jgi:hypothetical protein
MSQPPLPHRCPGPQPFAPRSRREFLKVAGCGFGLLGLADLLARDTRAATPAGPLAPRRPEPDGFVRPQAALEPPRLAAPST